MKNIKVNTRRRTSRVSLKQHKRTKTKEISTQKHIILLHKIPVAGMSRQSAQETKQRYCEILSRTFNDIDLDVKHIILPIGDNTNTEADVKLLYPNIDTNTIDELYGINYTVDRKLKIFKLLEEIAENLTV